MIKYQEKYSQVAGVDATGGYSSGDKKTLDIGEVLTHSQTLNTASQSLTSICDSMYNTITNLEENEAFKSKFASSGYYEKFNTLNGQVPKFTEGVLKFSKFLSEYLIGNYQDTDDEMKTMIEATLNDSLSQLAAVGVLGGTVDITKISATAQGAISGEGWIDPDKINKEAFADAGNLDFVTREDGSVMITRNGVPIGFTTEEAMKSNESAGGSASSNTTNEDFMNNQMMRNNPDMAKASQLASNTEGMGNNEAIIKARENGTLNNASQYTEKSGTSSTTENNEVNKITEPYLAEAEKNLAAAKSDRSKLSQYENYQGSQGRIDQADKKIGKYQQEVDNLKNGNYSSIIAEKEKQLAQKEQTLQTAKNYAKDYGEEQYANFTNMENEVSSLKQEISSLKSSNTPTTSTVAETSKATTNTTGFDSNVFYNPNMTSTNNQAVDTSSIVETAFKLDNPGENASSIVETAFKLDN